MTKELALSASRIKTADSCSWLYYCNYHLKLPQESNDGARRGSVVHVVLECLAKPRRKNYVQYLLEDVKCIHSVNRLIKKLALKEGIWNQENIDLVYKFLYTGLAADFHYNAGDVHNISLQEAEYAFEIGDPEIDGYKAIGFIDKHAVFDKQKLVKIGDYKSSKSKFSSKELENNVQAMMYSLVMAKKYPDYKSEVEFIFLKFNKSPIQKVSFTRDQLEGFEEYLKHIYSYLKDFSYQDAQSSYAAEKGFDKSWLCGRAEYPGELKDDGTPIWHCAYKFPFKYWAIVDEGGNNVRTAFTLLDLKVKAGEESGVRQKAYRGCPYWQNKLNF